MADSREHDKEPLGTTKCQTFSSKQVTTSF